MKRTGAQQAVQRTASLRSAAAELILRLTDHLPSGQHAQPVLSEAEGPDKAEYLVHELVEELRKVPDEWKQEVITLIRTFVRLANRPPTGAREEEEQHSAQQPSEQVSAQVA